MSGLKRTLKGLKRVAKDKVNQSVDSDGKVVRKARDLATDAGRRYEESGAKGKVDVVRTQIFGKLDEISGQAMYQLVQEHLAEQERFNDLIATKLHEALERISELEKRLSDK